MAIRKVETPVIQPLVGSKPASSSALSHTPGVQETGRRSAAGDAAALRGLTSPRAGRIGSGLLGGLINSVAPITVAGVTGSANEIIERVLEHAEDSAEDPKSLLPLLQESLR